MKAKNFLRFMLICMVALLSFTGLSSCSHSEPDPMPNEELFENVEFSVAIENGGGTGSSSSPATVTKGDTLTMTLGLKSSYTDPYNGHVYACEPKAVIKLSTKYDTLHVKDFQTLINVQENPARTNTTGSNPVVNSALQTFDVGGQVITFDLKHEIYSYINSRSKKIEMPYIKLNPARYGESQTKEAARPSPAHAPSVRSIRLTPLRAPLLAKSVTNAQPYDVTVSFSLDIENQNTKDSDPQTLSFEVNFPAVVETTTEVPDPTTTLSYVLNVTNGSQNVSSPFEKKKGEKLQLQLNGTTQCSYFTIPDLEVRTISNDLVAHISLDASKDAVEFENLSDLKSYKTENSDITTSGSNPTLYKGKQVITLGGGQVLTIDFDYQSYDNVEIEGESIALPYFKLENPQVLNVSVKEASGSSGDSYEVIARIRQDVTTVNTPEPHSETLEYVVRYPATKQQPKLVNVTYRKDWEWVEPHDNMPLSCYAIVYRDRTYSNGVTYTDKFRDYGKIYSWIGIVDPGPEVPEEVTWDTGKIVYYPLEVVYENDSTAFAHSSFAVPDIEHLRQIDNNIDRYLSSAPGSWDAYNLEISYTNLDLDLTGVTVVGQGTPSNLSSGWYGFYTEYYHSRLALWYDPGFNLPRNYEVSFKTHGHIKDQFLVIDGMMFTFNEFIEPFEFNDTFEDFPGDSNRGPGRIYTSEVRSRILGKEFYAAVVDTVFTPLE